MKLFFLLASFFIISTANSAVHDHKKVATISGVVENDCTFFKLVGVTEADPVKDNDPWFSVALDNPAHDTIVSLLLTSYTADKAIRVATTGKLACGFATLNYVRFAE